MERGKHEGLAKEKESGGEKKKKKKSKLKIHMTRDKAITDKTTPQKLGQVTASLPPGLCG